MSMDVSNYFWEIETADAQPSYMGGVFIVVGGSLTGPDRIRRPFSQSFFLAPQETNGYFVLNDILRVALDRRTGAGVVPVIANGIHVPGGGAVIPVQPNGSVVVHLQRSNGNVALPSNDDSVPVLVNGTVGAENSHAPVTAPESGQADLDLDLEGSHISEPSKEDNVAPALSLSNGDVNVRERAMNGFATSNGAEKRDNMCSGVAPNNANREAKKKQHVEVNVPSSHPDAPKKSYALIVMKGSPVSNPVEVAVKNNNTKVVEKIEKPVPVPVPAAAPTPTPATTPEATVVANDTNDSGNNSNEEQGYSIFVKNLPVQVKPEQLEEVYKKFGAIKNGGVQVRMSKFDRYWFGFVEFEFVESMQAAIEAQPVLLNGREVFCEEKRSSSRVVNGIHVRLDGNMNGGGGGNGFRGPLRNSNGYRNESYRGGGGRAPMRGGGRGQRPMSGPMRPRDAAYHHHHHHHHHHAQQQQQQQQRNFHNGNNGRPGFSLKGPVETPVAA